MDKATLLTSSADFLSGGAPLEDSFSPQFSIRGSEGDPSTARIEFQSPSLMKSDAKCHAFELKFLLSHELAEQVQHWAQKHLELDPYADPTQHDGYEIHTLYLDTPQLDMFHRREGYHNEKYRLRKYSNAALLFLEHKQRKGDRVAKSRNELSIAHWPQFLRIDAQHIDAQHIDAQHIEAKHSESWLAYRHTLHEKQLVPSCRMSYRRSAYMGHDEHGVVRLTMDRGIQGEVTNQWLISPVESGLNILTDNVICELKFRETLPQRFKNLIAEFKMESSSVSKYRRFLQAALGLLPGVAPHA